MPIPDDGEAPFPQISRQGKIAGQGRLHLPLAQSGEPGTVVNEAGLRQLTLKDEVQPQQHQHLGENPKDRVINHIGGLHIQPVGKRQAANGAVPMGIRKQGPQFGAFAFASAPQLVEQLHLQKAAHRKDIIGGNVRQGEVGAQRRDHLLLHWGADLQPAATPAPGA